MLRTEVKGYTEQQLGDTITAQATDGVTTIYATPVVVTSTVDATVVNFAQTELEKLPDEADITFTYVVVDRAGNRSFTSVSRVLRLMLEDIPANLPTPLVPAYDGTDPINDAQARAGIEVAIPAFPEARENDQIVVLWGAKRADPVRLGPQGANPDPVVTVTLSYALVASETVQGNVDVSYELLRSNALIGTPQTPADVAVDLRLVGGPDPDPETPEHGNLIAPTVIGGASGQSNSLTPEDVNMDAKLIIPWLGADGTSVFSVADELWLLWGGQPAHPLDPVTIAEMTAQADLEREVPSDLMKREPSGVVGVVYGAQRDFSGANNISYSPTQPVTVLRDSELPGSGTPLAQPVFTNVNTNGAIGQAQAVGDLPVDIPLYGNAAIGDSVTLVLSADNSVGTTPGTDIPDASMALGAVSLTAQHLTDRKVTVHVPRRWAYIVCRGSATPHYIAENSFGPVNSVSARTPVAVRAPSETTCPLPSSR